MSLAALLEDCSGQRGYEDPVYRFYHQSYKVFRLQQRAERIVAALQALAPHLPLNTWFAEIVREGTGKEFEDTGNDHWTASTRPILEAFFLAAPGVNVKAE